MIIKNGREVISIYREGKPVIRITKGDRDAWDSINAYLEVDKDFIWVTPWDIEQLLISSNVSWEII